MRSLSGFATICAFATLLHASIGCAAATSARNYGTSDPRTGIAVSPDGASCMAAIRAVERSVDVPPRLLEAIGMVESGRANSISGRAAPWPWTIDIAGADYVFESKSAAIAAVQAAQAAGTRSIDIGCMQINLMYHPTAFASLDEAFDPSANVQYAANFLQRLHAVTGDWSAAAAAYHSMTPQRGADYVGRLSLFWPTPIPSGLPPARTAATPSIAQIDPMGVLTPEFRARLMRDAVERAARNARMGLNSLPAGSRLTVTAGPNPGAALQPLGPGLHVGLSIRGTNTQSLAERDADRWAINSGARTR